MPDAEGNPVSEAEARTILRSGLGIELRKIAASYVVPIFWANEDAQGNTAIMHNGSGFFMRVAGPTLLITAAHVIRRYEADRAEHGNRVKAQVSDAAFDPGKHLVDIDDVLDIATIKVPDSLPQRLDKWTYQRRLDSWPPPPPMEGRGLFFEGYPALYRNEPSRHTVEWGLYGGLLTATSVKDDHIITQLDRDHLEPIGGLEPPPLNAWLGGMSGAPGWTVTQYAWRLAGVLYQYSTDYELFYFRRADTIRPDGTLVRA